MADGNLWRRKVQMAVEVTPGTPLPATRVGYFEDFALTAERDPRPHKFATGTRDNTRAFTQGPLMVGGSLSQPLSADEIVELALITLKGAVTPSVPSAGVYLWTFVPGSTNPDSATFEWNDGARGWRAGGVRGNSMTISGSVRDPAMVAVDLFGQVFSQQSLTGSLADRTPSFIEGWELKVYIDALGATPGTTVIADAVLDYSVQIGNNLGRKMYANNSNAVGAVTVGELDISGNLTIEASTAQALTEMNQFLGTTPTGRLVRLEFGQNVTIASTYKKYVKLDLPCYVSAVDLGGDDEGTRTYALDLSYCYDATNAFGVQVLVQNGRSAAW